MKPPITYNHSLDNKGYEILKLPARPPAVRRVAGGPALAQK